MIEADRRTVIGGAALGMMAIPTVAGLASWRWKHGDGRVLLHDDTLSAGRRFAAAGQGYGHTAIKLEGDRVRLARDVLDRRPAMIAGVTRHADQLLIEDVAREAGYRRVALLQGRERTCMAQDCRSGWQALGRMVRSAGYDWVEALAAFTAAQADNIGPLLPQSAHAAPDIGLVLGWVLAPKG
ncbi:hypothetical protein D6851_11005 [Altericroceibacterium spongiae]|uniref:Uncharacterized protein n=1 Tax=Altericroceibacterium spongiae TaxID=2320269 RepID=A0A420EJ11_9SPHN|nr:hypothetical protein [Altericroceibacterium spongiae]RKF20654.1 hypothetical protein D6851_11005 [Altericroceibacterium spongiae]